MEGDQTASAEEEFTKRREVDFLKALESKAPPLRAEHDNWRLDNLDERRSSLIRIIYWLVWLDHEPLGIPFDWPPQSKLWVREELKVVESKVKRNESEFWQKNKGFGYLTSQRERAAGVASTVSCCKPWVQISRARLVNKYWKSERGVITIRLQAESNCVILNDC